LIACRKGKEIFLFSKISTVSGAKLASYLLNTEVHSRTKAAGLEVKHFFRVPKVRNGAVGTPRMACYSIKYCHCTVTVVSVFNLTDRREG